MEYRCMCCGDAVEWTEVTKYLQSGVCEACYVTEGFSRRSKKELKRGNAHDRAVLWAHGDFTPSIVNRGLPKGTMDAIAASTEAYLRTWTTSYMPVKTPKAYSFIEGLEDRGELSAIVIEEGEANIINRLRGLGYERPRATRGVMKSRKAAISYDGWIQQYGFHQEPSYTYIPPWEDHYENDCTT